MSEALLLALIQFATRFGISAAVEFFRNRGTTIETAIEALAKAEAKSLDSYLADDKARRLPPPPA